MMSRPTVYILDAATGEDFVREMNDEEFAQWEADAAEQIAKEKANELKMAKKQAALAKLQDLGLDLEDLQALGL